MSKTLSISNRRDVKEILLQIGIPICGSIFLALMSQISIPLLFTPIPVTLQTLAVFLLGAVLGSRNGAFSVVAYLFQGTMGLPVFAGGLSNPLWYMEPKSGFLISFIVAAYAIGKMVEKCVCKNFMYLVAAVCIGQAIIFGIGTFWLALFVGVKKAFFFGVMPFLLGAVIKVVAACCITHGYYFALKK